MKCNLLLCKTTPDKLVRVPNVVANMAEFSGMYTSINPRICFEHIPKENLNNNPLIPRRGITRKEIFISLLRSMLKSYSETDRELVKANAIVLDAKRRRLGYPSHGGARTSRPSNGSLRGRQTQPDQMPAEQMTKMSDLVIRQLRSAFLKAEKEAQRTYAEFQESETKMLDAKRVHMMAAKKSKSAMKRIIDFQNIVINSLDSIETSSLSGARDDQQFEDDVYDPYFAGEYGNEDEETMEADPSTLLWSFQI